MGKKIQECLNKLGNPKKLPREVIQKGDLLRSTLLKNVEGKYLQAVFPAHCLLDLKIINGSSGTYRALSPERVKKFINDLGFESSPPICQALGVPVMVDLRFLTGDFVYIESGDVNYVYKLNVKQLDIIFADASIRKFVQPLRLHQPNISKSEKDEADFKNIIENFTQRRIQERLETELNIPPLPSSSRRLLELKNSDIRPDIHKFLEVIELDPVLSSQILRWANSPFYTRGKKVSLITDAISRVLSVELALDLSVGLSLTQHLKIPKDGVHGYNRFWFDSLRTGVFVNFLAEYDKTGEVKKGLAYTSGLLHNYGYLILAQIFPPYFSLYLRYQEANPHIPHTFIEEFLFGITRDQMASYLFGVWDLPNELKTAVRQQKNPFYSGANDKYANMLYIANNVLNTPISNTQSLNIPNKIYQNLGVNDEDILVAKTKLEDYNDEFFTNILMI